jgi:hypothetical protein
VIYLGVESVSRVPSSVPREFRVWRVQFRESSESSEFEFGELKSWGVVGRLSGIVFGEEVRN